jgi:hypothetical protein
MTNILEAKLQTKLQFALQENESLRSKQFRFVQKQIRFHHELMQETSVDEINYHRLKLSVRDLVVELDMIDPDRLRRRSINANGTEFCRVCDALNISYRDGLCEDCASNKYSQEISKLGNK